MGTPYTVQPGDTLSGIARDHGFASWREIYDHEDNADFRRRRPDPNRISPGDVLMLPDRESAPTPSLPEPAPSPLDADAAPSEAPPTEGSASRQTESSSGQTVLNAQYELREIIVAQGIEHHNDDPWLEPEDGSASGYRIPRGLEAHLPNNADHEWAEISDDAAVFVSHAQHVRYSIRLVHGKDEYKRALETAGVHVVYMGHSRYGRGQCFGSDPGPGDDWEQGANAATGGLFRTGYPIIGVHFTELEEHGYRFHPVAASQHIQADWYHPEINRGALRRVELTADQRARLLPEAQPPQDYYWGARDGEGPTLLLWAGWENTISAPMDLGATDPLCRCWCVFSCSTRLHYWRIVRRLKNWTRTEDDRFAYFTTNVSYPLTAWAWLRGCLEYSRRNDYQSWSPSLEWAKRRATQILARKGYWYAIY